MDLELLVGRDCTSRIVDRVGLCEVWVWVDRFNTQGQVRLVWM